MVEIFLINLLLALMGLTVLAVFIWIVKKLDDQDDLTVRLAKQEQWKRRNNNKI